MAQQGKDGGYKIPNKSSAYIKAPQSIQKDAPSPKVRKGGDLRAGK